MSACIASFFSYETTKSVVVKSWTLGLINRIVQLLILAYFIGWVFLHEKAYQVQDTAIESSVVTKVKGSGVYNKTIMDITDLVSPPQGSSVFSIITNMIITEDQKQDHCPEVSSARADPSTRIMTGRCVNSSNSVDSFCEVKGWCPTENDTVTTSPIMEVENFTIFIKNNIRFPMFGFAKGNLQPDITQDFLKTCSFHTQDNIYCPIFKVGDVLRFAQQDFYSIAKHGGVVAIKIGWVCDLDKSEEFCNPSYSFVRLDKKNNVSKGYNFRYAKYYKAENGTKYRTLIKAIAIRFDVIVYGAARKFNVIPTLINIVAALTSVGLSALSLLFDRQQGTVLCDIILLNFLKGAQQYKAKKFEEVEEEELEKQTMKLTSTLDSIVD
ncbi:P2X purinoceptor 3-like [Scleropages formosus]|uniref:P2X purinoceptor n=1 Tax=Scleropages formosus TaxID=113540 RepID=A0A0P7VEG6_SCLFO|nr:P2X purinoceptor 3-like [Scleropages formosus]